MIRLEGIWRTYTVGGRDLHALSGIDAHIESGEHVAIMGPSGSGKSTLLNIIGCLDRPSRGSYVLDGRQVGALDEEQLARVRREAVGCVFQAYHLVPRLDATGNVELPLTIAGVPRAERRERVAAALAAVDLTARATHRPNAMSGGECQRVAIARATIMQPTVLLADEPTGNLDRASGQQVLELLEHLNREGLTLVVVTHDAEVARRAERVILLEDGRVARSMPGAALTNLTEALRGISAGPDT